MNGSELFCSSGSQSSSKSSSCVGKHDSDSTDNGIKLEDSTVCSLRAAKLYRDNTEAVNSIDFSAEGESMISAADDDQIFVYNCESGAMKRTLKSKKYGVSLIRWTHAANAVIHGSTKIDDTIRYLSLYDNKYLRYFQGHTNRVTGLSMSPTDDRFLSTSLDKTLRIWDLRSQNCQGLMYLQGKPVASFDPDGVIFAAGMNSDSIKLYDLRYFEKGPFTTFYFPLADDNEWASLKFSPDGRQIMVTVSGSPVIRIIDAFSGCPVHVLSGHRVVQHSVTPEASYSPDSQYVFSGSEDGKIHVWNAKRGTKLCVLNAEHPRSVNCVQFNPKYMMMASACTDMTLWLPAF